MVESAKTIITCAVTGAGHTPSMSPYLPIGPEQIVAESVAAVEAGASLLHLHVRNPADGRPSADPALFAQIVAEIRERTDAIVVINTGGVQGMPLEDRLAPALQVRPEMCSFNLGAMCLGLFHLAERYVDWKHGWEPGHLEKSRGTPTGNTFEEVEAILLRLGEGAGMRFEFECYDVGHLYNLAHLLERRLVRPPLFIEAAFGFLGGVGAAPENVIHMKRVADTLFGTDCVWSAMAAQDQMKVAAISAILGGHIRVGLEDSLVIGNRLAVSNAEQVTGAKNILGDLGIETATPSDARKILHLPERPRGATNSEAKARSASSDLLGEKGVK